MKLKGSKSIKMKLTKGKSLSYTPLYNIMPFGCEKHEIVHNLYIVTSC